MNNKIKKHICNHKLLIYFLIIVICYIPFFMAFFPVISNYDGAHQIRRYVKGTLDTRNPILHTLILVMFYLGGAKLLNSASLRNDVLFYISNSNNGYCICLCY